MDIYIITGASKGLGLELAKQLESETSRVIGIARTNPQNKENFVVMDLYQTETLDRLMEEIIIHHMPAAASFTLINNAGMVEPIGRAGTIAAADIEMALGVNVTAPILLSNAFMRALQDFPGKKRILQISSGAGRHAYEGWSIYGATKAGLDHFSRSVTLEQERKTNPVQIASVAPGIIDTDMQATIRSSDENQFPLVDQFKEYKSSEKLTTASETAAKIIALLKRPDLAAIGPIIDIRNLQ